MKSFQILLIGSIILILISTGCINRKEESDSNHEKDIPEKYKDLVLDDLKFSPDGSKALISGFNNEVGVLVLYENGNFTKIFQINRSIDNSPIIGYIWWSMDSRSAVIGYRVGFIDRALIYHEGKIEILASLRGDLSRPVGWSNSGNLIFLGNEKIWSYKDGNFTKIMQPTSHRFYRAEWNAEKTEMILYGTYSYVLQYIDANNSIIKIETIDYQGGIGDVGWYPNNQELLIIGSRGTVFSFNSENITKLFSIHPEHEYNYISIEDFDVNELLNQALIVGFEWEGLIDATNQYTKGFIYLYDGSNFNQIDIDSDYVNKVEWNEQNSYAIIITDNDVWKYSNGELILLNENITRILALSFSSVENIGLLSGINSSIYMLSDDVLIDKREEFLSCLV